MYVQRCDTRLRAGRRKSRACSGGGIPLTVGVGAAQFVQGVFPGTVFIDVPVPGGIQHGDLAYILTQQRAEWIDPSGLSFASPTEGATWSEVYALNGVSSGNTVCRVFRKYIRADQATVRLNYTDTNATQDHLMGVMIVVRGVEEWDTGMGDSDGLGVGILWGNEGAGAPIPTLGPNRKIIAFLTANSPDVTGTAAYSNFANATWDNIAEVLDVSRDTFVGASFGILVGEKAIAGNILRGTVDVAGGVFTTVCSEMVSVRPK